MAQNQSKKVVWLDESQHHDLKVFSAQEGMTLKAFVNHLLEDYKNAKARN